MASRGSKGSAAAGGILKPSDLQKLNLDQLKAVKEQSDLEVNLLEDSLKKINVAAARLEAAAEALNDLCLRPQGKKMLVPLTASLYVSGTLDDSEKILVDVGTGYFIEKTMAEGKDYCARKLSLLKSNHDELSEMAAKKKNVADEAGLLLQAKIKQASTSA
ncbi:probable prefoldin subunit 5 [Zingiber officinale]|uniref:probable prefoldin subunit 5 n=1 Tax=Zingiber officinale TaxID=94328 RepID=UPI001C4D27A4|nr:probable prefoldin subunit 5 [Zingiber officinale]XP_042393625.1 probable prefoldin subunit 5 [Zingiber officinale]XP_042393626.1 probable prefoldin subunit 5 [Zingiber officinale]